MNLYTTTEILDVQHDMCHCIKEVMSNIPLARMKFSLIFTYIPDDDLSAKRCDMKAYIESIHIHNINSEATHVLFESLRQNAISEFIFSNQVPKSIQHAIVAEFGYPVIAPELLPLLKKTLTIREKGAAYEEISKSSDFNSFLSCIEHLDFFYKELFAPVTFHIASSSLKVNKTEYEQSLKRNRMTILMLKKMTALSVPILDQKNGQYYESNGYLSYLSACSLEKLAKEIKYVFSEFKSRISFQQVAVE